MTTTFEPDWASPPGDTIADVLSARGLSHQEAAMKLGWSLTQLESILDGTARITESLAMRLGDVLGASATFWITREQQFRGDLRRQLHSSASASNSDDDWVEQFPTRDMIARGWIANVRERTLLRNELLSYFGVPTEDAWFARYRQALGQVSFRTSKTLTSKPGAVAAWLRQGEILSSRMPLETWNPSRLAANIGKAKAITRIRRPEAFLPLLAKLGAASGVAVVVARTPAGCFASGATCLLSPTRAMLLMSFRYLSDDHFWFTFFHEIGHLLLHAEQPVFVEDGRETQAEAEANDFAENVLIPREHRDELIALPLDRRAIRQFALKVGVSPGIVVGQLQHIGRARPNQLNMLKARYTWK